MNHISKTKTTFLLVTLISFALLFPSCKTPKKSNEQSMATSDIVASVRGEPLTPGKGYDKEPTKGVDETPHEALAAKTAEAADQQKEEDAKPTPPPDPCAAVPSDMSCIPGTTFTRGIDKDRHHCDMYQQPSDGHSASVPSARISVDTFYMDKYEVTNGDFAKCQKAGKCQKDTGPKYADFNAPKQPITGISWFDARDYCAFAGKRMPTEAEWELAARGPDGDIYPWGNTKPNCKLTVIRSKEGRSCGAKKRKGSNPAAGRVMPVGSRPPGRYGLYDMAGNAQEWVADWWERDYKECGEDCLGHNPKGPCGGANECPGHEYRVVRGGSWYWDGSHVTGYHRRRHHPINKPYHHFGFRCAADALTK